jgi:hypothetical protein
MAKQKKIAGNFLVPCNALDAENPAEISLAENEVRQAMHPADQFDAFKTLADQGMSDEDIAARFGVSVAVVRQRLKLSRVSPKLIALYRKGETTLECLMAFAISDDHKQQEKIWKHLPEWSKEDAHAIRDTLTEAHVDADNKFARFVTIAVFEAAGGAVLRDLFDADSAGWITDPALLNRLVAEKLEREADSIRAQGWKWVEIMPDVADRGGEHTAPLRLTLQLQIPVVAFRRFGEREPNFRKRLAFAHALVSDKEAAFLAVLVDLVDGGQHHIAFQILPVAVSLFRHLEPRPKFIERNSETAFAPVYIGFENFVERDGIFAAQRQHDMAAQPRKGARRQDLLRQSLAECVIDFPALAI